MALPFITEADLESKLGRAIEGSAAIQAIDAACDIVRDVAGQTFNQQAATVLLDGTDTDVVMLPQLPVSGLSYVKVGGAAVTDYRLGERGMLFRGTVDPVDWPFVPDPGLPPKWPAGRQNVEVAGTFGYSDTDVPRSVRMVALEVASRIIVQGEARTENVGDVSVSYWTAPLDLTAGEKAILRTYKP